MRICRHDISARANLSEMASSAPEIPIKERAIHRYKWTRERPLNEQEKRKKKKIHHRDVGQGYLLVSYLYCLNFQYF